MKMTFRWYGEDDPVTLEKIRQIPGMKGIVSAVYDIPVGEVWPVERIQRLKDTVEKSGLELSVIESVPVHEDIKLGGGNRDLYIENYCQTLRNLAKVGIDCVCYNFMPVFDWTRSDSPYNGLTLCSGSLGVDPNNDIIDMVRTFADRIHFAHIRNVKITGEHCFEEAGHKTECGSLDIYGIIKAYHESGFDGYIRPDHGRMIWGESGRPGYGLYDRALGAVYINGIWEALDRAERGE